MPSPIGKTIAPSAQPALDLISLARLSHELACENLRALLLANPNYFGNVSGSSLKAVLNIKGDTAYESITSVSYCPRLEQLRATIKIKQESGYSLDIGAKASLEYVRFYFSYDDGSTWQDQGLSAVNVFDTPGPKPLVNLVTLQINPEEDFGFIDKLPLLRAILSWNSPPPPSTPDWIPVWGNVVDTQIQFDGPKPVSSSSPVIESESQEREEAAEAGNSWRRREDATPRKKVIPTEPKGIYANTTILRLPYLEPARRNSPSPAASLCTSR